MAISVKQLKKDFPEFKHIANDMISSRISMATRHVNVSVFGTRANDAIEWYACHLLAASPLGENVKIDSKDGRTAYLAQYEKIERAVTYGIRYV
jgi:hypothetical protein